MGISGVLKGLEGLKILGPLGQQKKVVCAWGTGCLVRNWQGMKMKRLSLGQIRPSLPGK